MLLITVVLNWLLLIVNFPMAMSTLLLHLGVGLHPQVPDGAHSNTISIQFLFFCHLARKERIVPYFP